MANPPPASPHQEGSHWFGSTPFKKIFVGIVYRLKKKTMATQARELTCTRHKKKFTSEHALEHTRYALCCVHFGCHGKRLALILQANFHTNDNLFYERQLPNTLNLYPLALEIGMLLLTFAASLLKVGRGKTNKTISYHFLHIINTYQYKKFVTTIL